VVLTGRDVDLALQLGFLPFVPGIVFKTALMVAFVASLIHLGPRTSDEIGDPEAESEA